MGSLGFYCCGTRSVHYRLVVYAQTKTFHDLGYSGDLFVGVQAARSWLKRHREFGSKTMYELTAAVASRC